MSMNSLANSAAARRGDIFPLDDVPQSTAEIASAAMPPPQDGDAHGNAAPKLETALNVLFGQIPTKILTLYVAVLAATVAFAAWEFALPNSPFKMFEWYSPGLSGIAVLVVSNALGPLAPFFQKPIQAS